MLNTGDYEALIEYYTEKAIDQIENTVDDPLDPDTFREKVPSVVEQTVAHTEVDDSDDYEEGTFRGDHVFKTRVWADNDHSFVFYASMLDADKELFSSTDGRDLDCEAWRTEWRWFANKDRFDHTTNLDEGPIDTFNDEWEVGNSPFTAMTSVVFGVVCARVYDRVADHYSEKYQKQQEETKKKA